MQLLQKGESLREDAEEIEQGPPERSLSYTPIIVARMTSLVIEGLVTVESTLCQFKVQVSTYLHALHGCRFFAAVEMF